MFFNLQSWVLYRKLNFTSFILDNLFSQTGQTLPGKKVKTYWVSADGKTADEIELTTLEKIKDTDRNKIVQGTPSRRP